VIFIAFSFFNFCVYFILHIFGRQWTDDGSMALCLADCLLVHDVLSDEGLKDLRLRFLAWWELGYNNAFSLDESRRGSGSVG
jgi:ADP-ribosyl-[dinitrogen reductase] hydrolase